jgi:hypothetical protein
MTLPVLIGTPADSVLVPLIWSGMAMCFTSEACTIYLRADDRSPRHYGCQDLLEGYSGEGCCFQQLRCH